MKFLIDREIDLNQHDLLKTSTYSSALKEIIINAPVSESFTVGLFGEWGSGKSSIVRTVQTELETSNSKIKFIVYDAWKYSNDSFRRMFLLKLQEELKFDKTDWFKSFYSNKSSDRSIQSKPNWTYIAITASILLLAVAIINTQTFNGVDGKITVAVIASFLAIMVNVLGRSLSDFKITVQEPMMFAPEQFEDCFNEMIPRVFENETVLTKINKYITGNTYISGLERLVIVIDNIDRCPKDKAYELITTIKSFLASQSRVIFLIPVDDEALKRHIISEEKSESKEAEEFLRKFFNLTLRIKPFKRFDLFDFTTSINANHQLGFSPTTIDLVSKEYATNPRRIIQFFNDLISELKIFELKYGKSFIVTNESLICKMLILRQEWPDYYKKISVNPNLINDEPELNPYFDKLPELKVFLDVTDSITRNEDNSVIETILSTFDRSSMMSTEIIDMVNKKDFEGIHNLLETKKADNEKLVNYLVERLNRGIKQKRFRLEVNNIFELVCFLDAKGHLDHTQNTRIVAEIRRSFDDFFKFVGNLDLMVLYAKRLSLIRQSFMVDRLKHHFSVAIQDRNENSEYAFTHNLFMSFLRNEQDLSNADELSKLFEIEIERSNSPLSNYGLSIDQLAEIVNDGTLLKIIKRVNNVNENDQHYKDLVYAGDCLDFGEDMFHNAISHLELLVPVTNDLKKEQVLAYIKALNAFLSGQIGVAVKQPNKSKINQLKSKLVGNRTVAGRIVNVIQENLNKDELKVVCDFLLSIYKNTRGGIDLSPEFKLIISSAPDGRDNVYGAFLELMTKHGFQIPTFHAIILQDGDFDLSNLALTALIIKTKEGKEYRVKDGSARAKLLNILDAYLKDKKSEVKLFLTEIIGDERAKSILTELILAKTKEEIIKLPDELMELSFSKINEADTVFDYADNLEFLMAAGARGNEKTISQVVKVIISKLQRQQSFEEGVKLLSEVRTLRPSDKKKLKGILAGIDDDAQKEKFSVAMRKFDKP